VPSADELDELEREFSAIALALFAPGTVEETLRQIVGVAERSVDGCDGAGIFVMSGAGYRTPAASRELVLAIDALQIEAGEGPCVDASKLASISYALDLSEDERWPTFGPAAVAAGVRSVLSVSLSLERPSALNLYARLPAAFGATDRAKGHLFATLARLAYESAERSAAGDQKADNLLEALRSRELIGQAQGILMERERITADQAFDVLRRASQHLNVRLRSVAETLVETGESPDTGTPVSSS
jgi:hypothetical protein